MISFPQKILNPFIQLDLHNGVFLVPPIPIPGMQMHISGGCLIQARLLGEDLESNGKIIGDGLELLARDHEVCSTIFPHLNIFIPQPGPNILIPLLILDSFNRCKLAATSVQLTDGPMAVTFLGVPFLGLNLACNDPVDLPTCLTINWGTINVGLTLADILIAVALTIVDIALGWISNKVFGALAGRVPRGLKKALFRPILRPLNRLMPKVNVMIYRGAKGRFASMAEVVGDETFELLFGKLAPHLLPQEMAAGLGQAFATIDSTAEDLARGLAGWIEERSETLPTDDGGDLSGGTGMAPGGAGPDGSPGGLPIGGGLSIPASQGLSFSGPMVVSAGGIARDAQSESGPIGEPLRWSNPEEPADPDWD